MPTAITGASGRLKLVELAAPVNDVLGTHIAHQDMSTAYYASALTAAGLPPEVKDADARPVRGKLLNPSGDHVKLIFGPATTAHEAVQRGAEESQ